MELLKKCKDLVIENTKNSNLSEEAIEIISKAALAVYLIKPKLVLEKLPRALQTINIIADERELVDIAHEDLKDFTEDDTLQNDKIAVPRMFQDTEDGNIIEKLYLLISLKDKDENYNELLCGITHELIHFLRDRDTKKVDNVLFLSSGLKHTYYDFENEFGESLCTSIEEGIVQFYTKQAISSLVVFAKDEDTLNIDENCLNTNFLNKYYVPTKTISQLARTDLGYGLVDDTFNLEKDPSTLEKFFNENICDNDFTFFSYLVDRAHNSYISDDSTWAVDMFGIMRILKKLDLKINKKLSK